VAVLTAITDLYKLFTLLLALVADAVALSAQQMYFGELTFPLSRLLLGGAIMVIIYFTMLLFIMWQNTLYMDLLRRLRAPPSSR
jgi:hypothetical protein